MVVADVYGRRRTSLLMSKELARSYDKKLLDIAEKLGIDVGKLEKRYAARAEKAADRMVRSLARTAKLGLTDAAAMQRAGLGSGDDYQLRAVIRTHVAFAYDSGRESQLRTTDAWDSLWGWEYVAVLDARTSELCQSLDGIKRPRDDPFWDRYSPPNHYNCRSSRVEVFRDEGGGDEVPDDLEEPLEL